MLKPVFFFKNTDLRDSSFGFGEKEIELEKKNQRKIYTLSNHEFNISS